MSSTNFAAAQERVLERRRLREAETRSRLAEQQRSSSLNHAALQRLPYPLNKLPASGISIWNAIRGREGLRPAYRVGQVDAELLDEELLGLLKGQVGDALKYCGPSMREDWSHEIQFVLRAALFKLSIWDHDASYGAALQNLKYIDSRSKGPVHSAPTKWQKSLYGLLTVGGRYAWGKWESWLINQESGYDEPSREVRMLSRLTDLVSATHSIAAFISFLVFLVNGRYRTLVDRILRIRLIPPSAQASREVSFEYLNRQLVWHAFTEFLLFLLPLVGISRWRRWLSRLWKKTLSALKSGNEDDEVAGKQGELGFLPERTCAICYKENNPAAASESDAIAASASSGGIIGSAQTDIANPYEAIPCGCIYCFVCLVQKLEAEEGEGWVCLRCGEVVKKCKPWNGDVLEDTRPQSSSGKIVGFAIDGNADTNSIHREEEEERHVDPTTASRELSSDEVMQDSDHWSTIEKGSVPDLDNEQPEGAN
ncbi:pex2/pex10/pex12 family protein [Aspergillus homomorphus CBS 101889]|uniref:Peroxisome biosynthesis protein Peroxin-2 n=1 Tax=Aspergillus homomorphus (strain CBS 101889) TaxID=1450537 RepID=A0A395HQE8_ASPHC|nr:peroxisome biosynthesis protein Peroxin-2 [Aspergillus homomorphus CBS 101889]RAL09970.1 peroxisome biosynthesis protein Peroxin-2 [Aspergillus homomorphus CBS 101889]